MPNYKKISKLVKNILAKWWVVAYAIAPLPLISYLAPNLSLNLLEAWLPYILVAYCLLMVVTAWKKRLMLTVWLMAWCVPPASLLYPYFKQKNQLPVVSYGTLPLRVAQINLLQFNAHTSELLETIQQSNADIIAFQEVDKVWSCQLESRLQDSYPYLLSYPQDNCYGMALFSRVPVSNWKIYEWEGYPAIGAVAKHNGSDTLVLSLHAASPITHSRYYARNRQLASAAELISQHDGPVILLGDFNTVPWDKPLRELKQKSKLRDSRLGYQATWPNWLGRYGIPIDYVLHSPEWQVVASKTQYLPGSDHRAIITDLQLNSCAL